MLYEDLKTNTTPTSASRHREFYSTRGQFGKLQNRAEIEIHHGVTESANTETTKAYKQNLNFPNLAQFCLKFGETQTHQ